MYEIGSGEFIGMTAALGTQNYIRRFEPDTIDAAAQRDLFFDAESYERDHFKSHFTK